MIITSLWQKIDVEFLVDFFYYELHKQYIMSFIAFEKKFLLHLNFNLSNDIHTPPRQMEIPKFHFDLSFYYSSHLKMVFGSNDISFPHK